MAAAREALAREDAAAAIVAFDEVLKQDPSHEEARAGLLQAGEIYKAQKAVREQFESAKIAFAEGEYTPALRILYRLPKGRYDGEIETFKFNAWFNLGLVSLRAGNCKEALSSFDEALAIRPRDENARRLKDLAVKFQDGARDRAFFDRVEAIPFRRIDE